jgi:predicted transcriptional regulator
MFLLREGPQTFDELLIQFNEDCSITEMRECIDYLKMSGLMKQEGCSYSGIKKVEKKKDENIV